MALLNRIVQLMNCIPTVKLKFCADNATLSIGKQPKMTGIETKPARSKLSNFLNIAEGRTLETTEQEISSSTAYKINYSCTPIPTLEFCDGEDTFNLEVVRDFRPDLFFKLISDESLAHDINRDSGRYCNDILESMKGNSGWTAVMLSLYQHGFDAAYDRSQGGGSVILYQIINATDGCFVLIYCANIAVAGNVICSNLLRYPVEEIYRIMELNRKNGSSTGQPMFNIVYTPENNRLFMESGRYSACFDVSSSFDLTYLLTQLHMMLMGDMYQGTGWDSYNLEMADKCRRGLLYDSNYYGVVSGRLIDAGYKHIYEDDCIEILAIKGSYDNGDFYRVYCANCGVEDRITNECEFYFPSDFIGAQLRNLKD